MASSNHAGFLDSCKTRYLVYAGIVSLVLGFIFSQNFSSIKYSYYSLRYHLIKRIAGSEYVATFSNIYASNIWQQGSGEGSDPVKAAPYIALLQYLLNDTRFNSFADLGCGDWRIMQQINIPAGKTYDGYDVVPELIRANKRRFDASNINFYVIKDLEDFKRIHAGEDLLIVKDVLQHWPIKDIQYFLTNILPQFKYALITNSLTADVKGAKPTNSEIVLGDFRPIALTQSPFNLTATVLLEYPSPGLKQVLLYVNPRYAHSDDFTAPMMQ